MKSSEWSFLVVVRKSIQPRKYWKVAIKLVYACVCCHNYMPSTFGQVLTKTPNVTQHSPK